MSTADPQGDPGGRSRAGGRGRSLCAGDARAKAALARLGAAAARGERLGGWDPGGTTYAKGGPLTGRVRLRHGLRAALGLGLPRLREFENLRWLRAHGFAAPEPLAALVVPRGGPPRWQGLATARVAGARELRTALHDADEAGAGALCTTVGAVVGRLHAAGFLHRDLYVRNLLLVDPPPTGDGRTGADPPATLAFVDAWRGGADRPARLAAGLLGRDQAYDLGCLFVHLPGLVGPGAQHALLDAYAEARDLAPRQVVRLLARVASRRARAARREVARRRRDQGEVLPRWQPPGP